MVFELRGHAVGIEAEDRDREVIRQLLPGYLVPGAERPPLWYRCRRTAKTWVVEDPRAGNRRTFRSAADAWDAIEYLVSWHLLRANASVPQVHAAGAVTSRGAVLALGQSGGGKSSIALHWSMNGLRVLGDDVVLLEGARIAPFKRLFSVSPTRLARYPVTTSPLFDSLSDDEDAWYDPARHGGAGWAEPAPAVRIGVVEFVADLGARIEVEPLGAPALLNHLSASLLPGGAPSTACFDHLVSIARRAEGMILRFGEAGLAADYLARP